MAKSNTAYQEEQINQFDDSEYERMTPDDLEALSRNIEKMLKGFEKVTPETELFPWEK